MATQLFFRPLDSDWSSGTNDAKLDGTTIGWVNQTLSLVRGDGLNTVTYATVDGPTSGVDQPTGTSAARAWISDPLDADVTIAGSITWNLWAIESNMSANAAINGILEQIDGATGALTEIDRTARTTELGTTVAVQNFAETPAAGVACKRGDRLRVRVFIDDAGTMNTGFTCTFDYDAAGAGVDGDSYLTLTEDLTFVSEPAGSTVYLTDTASDVSTASVDREAWTSRGAGVQNDVTNTAAGWTSPIQVTDTAGGTVVDWFTKQLSSLTLGGGVRCNIRARESNGSANASVRVEVAVVDADGTNPVVWGATTNWGGTELSPTAEEVRSFLVSGDDLAVSGGQRLRIRLYADDSSSAAMGTGFTVTTYYAGTSGAASGDTYLTFSGTLTEYVPAVANPPYSTPYPQILAQ